MRQSSHGDKNTFFDRTPPLDTSRSLLRVFAANLFSIFTVAGGKRKVQRDYQQMSSVLSLCSTLTSDTSSVFFGIVVSWRAQALAFETLRVAGYAGRVGRAPLP